MSNPIFVKRLERLLVITFNRPKVRSPLSSEVLGLIEAAVENVEGDDSIDRVVFTGVEDVFASGADLNEIRRLSGSAAKVFGERGQRLMGRIDSLRAETVAAVNGFCFGGALDLALACNTRIAAPTATFCHP
nr:enoyl-CoA hydratase/isomerase family protein [Blastocatellia bacterium]